MTFCHGLKLIAPDGKMRETDCASTEGIFRIIQSIPSPKAEPFKRWLARVGYERVQEIENPELATRRTRMLYKFKGNCATGPDASPKTSSGRFHSRSGFMPRWFIHRSCPFVAG